MAFSGKPVFFLAIIGFYSAFVFGLPEDDELLFDLLGTYNRNTPPNTARNESVTVKFGISLRQITRVNEDENSITVQTWLETAFTDYRLAWDPAKYNVEGVRIPYKNLWLPDITPFNGLSVQQLFGDTITAVISNKGHVVAISPTLLTASCDMDLTFFPYDTQSCPLKFSSWTYDDTVMTLKPAYDQLNIGSYTPNPEWELINSSVVLNTVFYQCCPDNPYSDITATLEIKRRNGPYTVKLVIPSVLVAFLILFTFLLPSSSGEKIVFCLILLLILILLLVYLHISTPSNSESVLGEFLTFALFLDFFATIIAVVCYNIADGLLMKDKMGGPESDKHWASRKRKLKILRITECVFFLVFLLIFIIGTAVILTRRG